MRTICKNESGGVLVLVAVSTTLFFVMLAMALDFGWAVLARGELQAAADSAALAGAAKLADEELVLGRSDQLDDIAEARDYAEQFANHNTAANRLLLLDRNDANEISGGVVVGYIDDPLDLNGAFETTGVPTYNSVEVRTVLSQALNGPLALFLGGVTGTQELEMSAQATATLEDRIVGFAPGAGDPLMMLPFAIYVDTWYESTDGADDRDDYRVINGEITSGSDGIPEIRLYPYRYNMVIPGIKGNVGTLFICGPSGVNTTAVTNQIYDGISQENVLAAGGLELVESESGDYIRWTPGESWMSSSWHYALRNISGEVRIIALFRGAVNSRTSPTAFADDGAPGRRADELASEVCCGIYQHYELVEFKAVTVVDSEWPRSDYDKYWTVQPAQAFTASGKIDPDMPRSELVYTLSLTR